MNNGNTTHLRKCMICGSEELKRVYDFEEFHVLKCGYCKNAWRSNMYDENKINEIYCQSSYEDNPYFSYDISTVHSLGNNRFKNFDRALKFLKKNGHKGRLLDIGCGSGAFLSMAKDYGWELTGIEISSELSEVCRKNVPNAEVINESFENSQLEPESFDLITMWDVIEHVIDPIDVITQIKGLLVKGGVALFCTPDESSLLANIGKLLYNASWKYPALALHPPNHTYFFSREGFGQMLKSLDLQILEHYSQDAFFEHSEMASKVQKLGVSAIEKFGGISDSKYEMVVMATNN